LAGFSPIPYKITITAGTIFMPIVPFILASAIGRGARFFLVAGLMRWGGARMKLMLHTHIDRLGWITRGIVVIVYFVVVK